MSNRMPSRPVRSAGVTIITLCALPILLACAGDTGQQRPATDAAQAAKLTGTWDITLQLNRPLSLRTTGGGYRVMSLEALRSSRIGMRSAALRP